MITQMKRTTLIILTLLITQVVWAQNSDSLQTEDPKVEIIEQETTADSLMIPEEPAEPLTIEPPREIARDTLIVEEPVEIQAENVNLTTYRRRRGGNDIKTISGSLGHSGGFGALSFRSTKFRDETMVLAGVRGGWIINRTLAIGLEGHGIIPTAKYQGLSTFEAVAVGGYGGLFLEPIFFSNEVVHVTFPVSSGAGWLGYHEDFDEGRFDDPDLIEGDVFWYVEPGANVEFNLARNFRLAMGVSKRFTQDLQLVDTDPKAFNKINYYLTLKIGSF